MTLNCSVSSSSPATTNVVMGFVGNNNFYLDLTTASASDKKIVNDFIGVIGTHLSVNILDYDGSYYFEANIVVPEETDLEEITIEFPSLTTTKKNKVDAFVNLMVSISS